MEENVDKCSTIISKSSRTKKCGMLFMLFVNYILIIN